MMYKLPTYKECLQIIKGNDSFVRSIQDLGNDIRAEIFTYGKFVLPDHFYKPLEDSDVSAIELRGLTYIFSNQTLIGRYPMLHKFWNINQVEQSMYEVVKNWNILRVNEKEDGSLIAFHKLPDNRIVARSKASFHSDQALMSNEYLKSHTELLNLLEWSFDMDITLYFELVSPDNKIVLCYDETELRLLKGRRNSNGEYINVYDIDTFGVKVAKCYDYTLDELMSLAETEVNREGWIVECEEGLLKIKTQWYFENHRLHTMQLNRSNEIIKLILDEEIDDVLTQLDSSQTETKNRIYSIMDKIHIWVENYKKDVNNFISENYKPELGEFAMRDLAVNHRKNPLFGPAASHLKGNSLDDIAEKRLRQLTYKLTQADAWLEKQ